MTAIDTTDLTKRYETTLTVDSLSLTISEGTIYGFIGPNGAEKTTTMRMLTGLKRPTSGSASVAGVSVDDRSALLNEVESPLEPALRLLADDLSTNMQSSMGVVPDTQSSMLEGEVPQELRDALQAVPDEITNDEISSS